MQLHRPAQVDWPLTACPVAAWPTVKRPAHWPTKENKLSVVIFFAFFRSMEKIAWDGPKWGREGLFPANPDLADILGDMDLHFANFHV